MSEATARAMSNIAFIKYWGNQDDDLRLPVNSSLSMNLDGLYTETKVRWDTALKHDELILNDSPATPAALERVSLHLDRLRQRLGRTDFAHVTSANNFPMGAGIASSASAFAALTKAAIAAAGADLDERELSTLARLGSGSASRSIPSGFVEWHMGHDHASSFAESIAAPDHWDLVDVIAIISEKHKATVSQAGHKTAPTSPFQTVRVAGAAERLDRCRAALLGRDFSAFAEVVEEDSNLMHAVMMTSQPALFYWEPATLTVMQAVRQWREQEGLQVCYTLDAGPNVHCICVGEVADHVREKLARLSDSVDIRVARAGGPAMLM